MKPMGLPLSEYLKKKSVHMENIRNIHSLNNLLSVQVFAL